MIRSSEETVIIVISKIIFSTMDWTTCDGCSRSFASKYTLSRHVRGGKCKKRDQQNGLSCEFCKRKFSRMDNLNRHMSMLHPHGGGGTAQVYLCGMCEKSFASLASITNHRELRHKERTKFKLVSSAHNRTCQLFRLIFPDHVVVLDDAIQYMRGKSNRLIKHQLSKRHLFKASFVLNVRFCQADFLRKHHLEENREEQLLGLEGTEVITMNFRTETHQFMRGTNIKQQSADMMQRIINTFEDFVHNGSGWVLVDCISYDVEIGQCLALSGSCCDDGMPHTVMYRKGRIVIDHPIGGKPPPPPTAATVGGGGGDGDNTSSHRCFYIGVASYFLTQRAVTIANPTAMQLEHFVADNLHDTSRSPMPVASIGKFEEANAHLDLSLIHI